jgi:glutathione S-transferase
MVLKLYGVPLSQPCRAIIWTCLYKKLPFELVLTNPGSKGSTGSRNPNYLAINPTGTIPAINDDGFTLWESNAILTYLAQKHGWADLYPADVQKRSLIDQYLHFHHRNSREASIRLAAPNFRKDLKFPDGHEAMGQLIVANSLKLIEETWLMSNNFIAADELTLADFACYMEFGQLSARFGNLVDFESYPRVQQWMKRMEEVPYFEEANMANQVIGDLNDGVTKETIIKANKQSTAAIMGAVSKL